ncbi:MAG: hypothetical protein OXJ55_21945 [Caldilineaceae bacterium]|nr:hypothetical protein [Caldilineaceae bacterium]MDE0464676.1 hypothetical protein [Caldilineaceae bacterium]MXX26166.1 hypothetical protein [Caldilineaceae bacterium SB0668_bin_21]MYC20679.1 hypothetical protein [Caldilineaceae bacterium SB0662_bin_25]
MLRELKAEIQAEIARERRTTDRQFQQIHRRFDELEKRIDRVFDEILAELRGESERSTKEVLDEIGRRT